MQTAETMQYFYLWAEEKGNRSPNSEVFQLSCTLDLK